MSKLLVILTGGTIGSCVQENVISAKSERSAEIVARYENIYGKHEIFDVEQPLNELSENLHPGLWQKITDVIDRALEKDYEGIIITHGSDTLAFTSAFMAMHYANAHIPIIMIAANYPLDDVRSNGMKNFAGAVSFIKENAANGVFTIYENMKSEVEVFLPTRMLNSDPYFDQYQSFDREIFGWMKDGRFVANASCLVTLEMVEQRERKIQSTFHYENEVMFIQTYLGINFRNFSCGEKVKAVMISLYHSATGPATENSGLLEFLESCGKRGIQVYAASFKDTDMKFYASTDVLLKRGLQPLCNISDIAAYVKLVLAYNQKEYEVDEFVKNNIFFECLENKT